MTIRDAPSHTTWTMYFDGASNSRGRGVGIVLVSPRDEHIPISIKLEFECINNMAEYEACIVGLEAALSLEVQEFDVLRNMFADALATLASMVDIPVGIKVCPLAIKRHVIPTHVHMVQIAARCPNGKPWYFDIKNLISGRGHLSEASLKEKRALQKLTSRCNSQPPLVHRRFYGAQEIEGVDILHSRNRLLRVSFLGLRFAVLGLVGFEPPLKWFS
ncbi:uncharacterized protein LOC143852465 [Tasmannia lanceolata]|uniref:uncharacterized protein LOC143852465 n=1 Tax=Tasmannia lanceolata TaxID=3420 RepID=UPI004062C025